MNLQQPPTAAASGWTLLSTVTASAASSADVETTFSSTYDAYVIVGSGVTFSANTSLNVRLKLGGAYDTGSNYAWHAAYIDQTLPTYQGNNSTGDTSINMYANTGTGADRSLRFMLRVYDPTSTAFAKAVDWDGSTVGGGGGQSFVRLMGGGKNSATTALTGVRFLPGSGTLSGKFRLYGIQNS